MEISDRRSLISRLGSLTGIIIMFLYTLFPDAYSHEKGQAWVMFVSSTRKNRLAWERLGILPEGVEEVAQDKGIWKSQLELLPPRPDSG